jgi:adenylate cyclase, class 2
VSRRTGRGPARRSPSAQGARERAGHETEIKLRLTSRAAGRRALARLGAKRSIARHFEDNLLFDDAARTLLAGGGVLRLRRTPKAALLTYKGPKSVRQGVRSRLEIETRIEDGDSVQRILEALGYLPRFHYQKHREAYRLGRCEIVLDETPIGIFLEIEGPPASIHRIAAALGRSRADYLLESYVSLFFAQGGRGDMVFERLRPRSGERGGARSRLGQGRS